MTVYAIIPARSGSKGLPDKNVAMVGGRELVSYAIAFGRALCADRVICSTDSARYAEIAVKHGAEVPFLRSPAAACDTAMEEDILEDLYAGFDAHQIPYPDLFVWLRATFVFRYRPGVLACIDRLMRDPSLTACRVATEADARLYRQEGCLLRPDFDDRGRSMVRRQDIGARYRVFNTDVFRGRPRNTSGRFLGDRVGFEVAPKLCGLDIDDAADLQMVDALLGQRPAWIHEYVF